MFQEVPSLLLQKDLLNEKLRHGCRRAYIKAERRRAKNSQKEINHRIELTNGCDLWAQENII